jgi:hypothetical protein
MDQKTEVLFESRRAPPVILGGAFYISGAVDAF